MRWFILLCAFATATLHAHNELVHVSKTPTADTSLFENLPNNNLGAVSTMVVGSNMQLRRGRALLKFDLANALPTNAEIAEVFLTLKVVTTAGMVPSNVTYHLHRFLKPWIEGTGSASNNGSPALQNEPSWNSQSAPGTPWSAPGAAAGVEFVAVPSASQQVSDQTSFDLSSTNMLLDVQRWIARPEENHGWIIFSGSENVPQSARRFGSREDTNRSPVLTISYALPKPEYRIEEASTIPGFLILHLDLEENHAYNIQHRPSFAPGTTWQVLTNFKAEPFYRHWVLPDTLITNQNRFYRLEITPPANPH